MGGCNDNSTFLFSAAHRASSGFDSSCPAGANLGRCQRLRRIWRRNQRQRHGTAQSPSNAAGGLIELRHISNPLVGYEASYSFNRANQHYEANYSCPAAGSTCPAPLPITVPANAHQIALNWVVSAHVMNIRPFALAGVGVLLDEVSGSPSGSSSTVKPVYIYGAGVDWGLLPHIGLRLQYRGNLYKAPDLAGAFSSTDRFAHTGQPMIGAYFRF